MNKEQWDTSTDPAAMLSVVGQYQQFGEGRKTASVRKLRLWVFACREVEEAKVHTRWHDKELVDAAELEACVESWATGTNSKGLVPMALRAGLLRCIIGNPFRPVARGIMYESPLWHAEDRLRLAIFGLARGVYSDRAWDRCPILADALEEAGCTNADILAHLRGPGPHARGCHVLDLILGKG
jgi:hypothetical protein